MDHLSSKAKGIPTATQAPHHSIYLLTQLAIILIWVHHTSTNLLETAHQEYTTYLLTDDNGTMLPMLTVQDAHCAAADPIGNGLGDPGLSFQSERWYDSFPRNHSLYISNSLVSITQTSLNNRVQTHPGLSLKILDWTTCSHVSTYHHHKTYGKSHKICNVNTAMHHVAKGLPTTSSTTWFVWSTWTQQVGQHPHVLQDTKGQPTLTSDKWFTKKIKEPHTSCSPILQVDCCQLDKCQHPLDNITLAPAQTPWCLNLSWFLLAL